MKRMSLICLPGIADIQALADIAGNYYNPAKMVAQSFFSA